MWIADLIRERGPLTVSAFMNLALYDPANGYYARAAQRSGRAGDFFTSVDVGPLFGELLAAQVSEMLQAVGAGFDVVEAGAGNGRLSADILRALRQSDPSLYTQIALHLVEASAAARQPQRAALGDCAERLVSSGASLPESFEGVLIANELLDAMPVHQVVMRPDGLKEVFVDTRPRNAGGSEFTLAEREPSTPRLAEYLDAAGVRLEPHWRAEINLNAVDWAREAARRLRRGFIVLVDYGHEARELYSVTHSSGTLTTFSSHRSSGADSATPAWLLDPGGQDMTAHVDFTSVRAAAEAEGMRTLGLLDQTYFVLGLTSDWPPERLTAHAAALKTLMLPGGLGSTMKVLILGKHVGTPRLRGCSFRVRMT